MMDTTPVKTVYFVRHGQSEANSLRVFQGADSPLSLRGKQQAEFVAERMRSLGVEVILASPMPRALDTARVIEQAVLCPLEVHESLRELLPPSTLIGMPYETPEGVAYMHERIRNHDNVDYRYGDEESYRELHERACTILATLESRTEKTLLVVTHAAILRIIMTAMMTEGEANPYLAGRLMRFLVSENTGVSVFQYDPSETHRSAWRLSTFNDYAHLAETILPEP